MSPQEMATRINDLNREIQGYKAAHGQWAAKQQNCRGHVQALHNRQMPNNEQGREQLRRDRTMWQNRLREAETSLNNLNDRIRRRRETRDKLQKSLDDYRARQQHQQRK